MRFPHPQCNGIYMIPHIINIPQEARITKHRIIPVIKCWPHDAG